MISLISITGWILVVTWFLKRRQANNEGEIYQSKLGYIGLIMILSAGVIGLFDSVHDEEVAEAEEEEAEDQEVLEEIKYAYVRGYEIEMTVLYENILENYEDVHEGYKDSSSWSSLRVVYIDVGVDKIVEEIEVDNFEDENDQGRMLTVGSLITELYDVYGEEMEGNQIDTERVNQLTSEINEMLDLTPVVIPDYEVVHEDDSNLGDVIRLSYWILPDDVNATEDDLKLIAEDFIKKVKKDTAFNVAKILFVDDPIDVELRGNDMGYADYAPSGDWAKASDYDAGVYSIHRFDFSNLRPKE
ncbi:hypothetical protein [Jeotgalibacillus marinus]|uniref:Uncharacterized protein n=1 Tax=Jeotgalibacillus marinus TaxID=86667 RepID=A0ABV3Q6J2_9BACL